MNLVDFLVIGYVILAFCVLYLYLTRPSIDKRHIIQNIIQAQVEAAHLFTDGDKLSSVVQLLQDINFANLEPWQVEGFIRIVESKLKNK